MLPKTVNFGFPFIWLWAYPIKIIPWAWCAHEIRNLCLINFKRVITNHRSDMSSVGESSEIYIWLTLAEFK